MKKLILFTLLFTSLLSCCDNDDNEANEVLPPATQTGAGTFACKINGQSFIDTSGGYFNCFYQLIDGEYFFGIGGNDEDYANTNTPWSISLGTTKKTISENEVLPLLEIIDGNASGDGGFSFSNTNNQSSSTSSQYTGELTITKLDFTNHIVSGTFWFNIKHPTTGATVEIREGRFDTLFTQ